MRQHRTVAAAIAAVLALVSGGCGVTSQSSRCSANVCKYTFNGAQTLDTDFLRPASTLDVKDIGERQITVARGAGQMTLTVGKPISFGGFLLDLQQLDGDKGTLIVRNAPN